MLFSRAMGNRQVFSGNVRARVGKRALRLVPAFTVLLLAVWMAPSASGDPVRVVTGGDADIHEGDATFLLLGRGFRLSGEIPLLGDPLGACRPCAPGTAINLSSSARPGIHGEPAVFDGRTYEGFTPYGGVYLTGNLAFTAGSVIAPPVPAERVVERVTPFTFTGLLIGYDNFALTGTPLFSANLRGRGLATLSFSGFPNATIVETVRLTYNFEDLSTIPEPGTMLLLGSGLATLAVRRISRRHA